MVTFDCSFAHLIAPVKKGIKETFWYRLAEVNVDNGR